MKLLKVSQSDEITQLFSDFGKIKQLVVPRSKTGKNKGYAFVTYENCESVNAVFDNLKSVKLRAKEVN